MTGIVVRLALFIRDESGAAAAQYGMLLAAVRAWSHNGRKGLVRDESGAIAAIVAIFLTVLFGFAAFAIDMSYAYSTRTLLQTTASVAALAAVKELPNQAQVTATAKEYAEENMPAANHGTVLADVDVVLGNWNPGSKTFAPGNTPINAVQVTTRRSSQNSNELELFLAPVLGMNSLDMEASAVAYYQVSETLDVALVQDVTGSFTGQIETSKEADHALLNCLSAIPETEMGLTVFTGYTYQPDGLNAVLPIQDNFQNLSDAIDAIDQCGHSGMPICNGGTNIGIGLEKASQMLAGSDATRQVIVLVTDGGPFVVYGQGGSAYYQESEYYDDWCGGSCSSSDLQAMAELAAAAFGSVDTHDIYVIYYAGNPPAGTPVTDPETWLPDNIVQGQGTYQSTLDPEELDSLMSELCSNISDLRLVQ